MLFLFREAKNRSLTTISCSWNVQVRSTVRGLQKPLTLGIWGVFPLFINTIQIFTIYVWGTTQTIRRHEKSHYSPNHLICPPGTFCFRSVRLLTSSLLCPPPGAFCLRSVRLLTSLSLCPPSPPAAAATSIFSTTRANWNLPNAVSISGCPCALFAVASRL